MPMLAAAQNVVHNDSRDAGPASWHDEAPVWASVSGRNLVEPLGRVAPDGQSLQRGPGRLLRCQEGTPAEATAITSRLGGPGRQTRAGAAPEGLRHPDPLSRGVGRGVSRQHKHPVEGPATSVAEPTAGCGVCARGCGYPKHVASPVC